MEIPSNLRCHFMIYNGVIQLKKFKLLQESGESIKLILWVCVSNTRCSKTSFGIRTGLLASWGKPMPI